MAWLRNTWYAGAWSDEITDKPLGRTLLDEPVVFFRQSNGQIAAIGGRCPHRFAPLAMGSVVDDSIQCPYHGLRFNHQGACVHNPHGEGKIPSSARVKQYRTEERWGMVWLWAGESEAADVTTIPDLSHLERTDLGHVKGYMQMAAHYQLGVDNLIDLSHVQFVHGDRLGSNNFAAAAINVEQDGNTVVNRISIPNSDVPLVDRENFPNDGTHVDMWLDSAWHAPSIVTNDTGATRIGASRDAGVRTRGVHIVTPETLRTSHYFYSNSRNYAVGDPTADEKIREWQRVGFGLQDKPIIEATARLMGDEVDPMKLKPVLLPADAAAVRARRVLDKMIAEETKSAAAVCIPLSEIKLSNSKQS